jgi:hypothetical protein
VTGEHITELFKYRAQLTRTDVDACRMSRGGCCIFELYTVAERLHDTRESCQLIWYSLYAPCTIHIMTPLWCLLPSLSGYYNVLLLEHLRERTILVHRHEDIATADKLLVDV